MRSKSNSPFPSTMVSSPALLINTAPLYHHNKQLGQAQYEVGKLKHELEQTRLEAERSRIGAEGKIFRLEALCKSQQEKLDIILDRLFFFLERDLRMLFESEEGLKKEMEDSRGRKTIKFKNRIRRSKNAEWKQGFD